MPQGKGFVACDTPSGEDITRSDLLQITPFIVRH
jgi:hypothetical protein